jgi:hypothetical protein
VTICGFTKHTRSYNNRPRFIPRRTYVTTSHNRERRVGRTVSGSGSPQIPGGYQGTKAYQKCVGETLQRTAVALWLGSYAPMTGGLEPIEKGQRVGARPHTIPCDQEKGRATRVWGLRPNTIAKVGFCYVFGFFFQLIMPIISRFTPFLGDIRHFWRPDSWRKLGMLNQLQGYINQAYLRLNTVIQSRVMLKKSQAKGSLMQGSL